PIAARLERGAYRFALPPELEPRWLDIQIGDARRRLRIEPVLRPELTAIIADVALPGYLGRTNSERKDVRGSTNTLGNASRAECERRAEVGPGRRRGAEADGGQGIEPFAAGRGPDHDRVPVARCAGPQRQGAVHLDGQQPRR